MQRRADNTMAKKKMTKRHPMIDKILNKKLKIYQHDPNRSTWVHPRFLVWFVLLDLRFYVYVLWIVVCLFVRFLFPIVLSVLLPYTDYPFSTFRLRFLPRKDKQFQLHIWHILCYFHMTRKSSDMGIVLENSIHNFMVMVIIFI